MKYLLFIFLLYIVATLFYLVGKSDGNEEKARYSDRSMVYATDSKEIWESNGLGHKINKYTCATPWVMATCPMNASTSACY